MAAVDLNTVRAAIETHFIAGFGAEIAGFGAEIALQSGDILVSQNGLTIVTQSVEVGFTPLVFYNQNYNPTPNDSFIQCLVTFDQTAYLTMGVTSNALNQVFGTVRANIFTPQGTGPGSNYELADRVCSLCTREIFEGIQLGPLSGPSVIAAPQPSAFFQTAISVPFNVFEQL